MATGDTDVTVCSEALIYLGASSISSLSDGSDAAAACSALYPDLKTHLLTVYPWSWSLKKVQLSQNVTDPVNEWKNSFDLPADRLSNPQAVFASSAAGIRPLSYGWEIYGTQLFTNMETVYIDYQATVTEENMPAYFIRVLRAAMAAELAMVITDQVTKADYFRGLAYGSPAENGRGGLLREAMNVDSRGQLPPVIEDYSLIDVRG
jgi:hypothetical protein